MNTKTCRGYQDLQIAKWRKTGIPVACKRRNLAIWYFGQAMRLLSVLPERKLLAFALRSTFGVVQMPWPPTGNGDMFQTFNEQTPAKLIEYLDTNFREHGFRVRRRAVLAQSDEKKWSVVCCVVEAFPGTRNIPQEEKSRRYPKRGKRAPVA